MARILEGRLKTYERRTTSTGIPAGPFSQKGRGSRQILGCFQEEVLRAEVRSVVGHALASRCYADLTYSYLAKRVGVEPLALRHAFPSKPELVLAALAPGAKPFDASALALPGCEIVVRYLDLWESGHNTVILKAILAASTSDADLTAAVERHVVRRLLEPFASSTQLVDACPRVRLVLSLLLGIAVSRYVLLQEPFASADHDTIAAWAGPLIEHGLRGDLCSGARNHPSSFLARQAAGENSHPRDRARDGPRRPPRAAGQAKPARACSPPAHTHPLSPA